MTVVPRARRDALPVLFDFVFFGGGGMAVAAAWGVRTAFGRRTAAGRPRATAVVRLTSNTSSTRSPASFNIYAHRRRRDNKWSDRFLKDKTANKGPKHVTPSSLRRHPNAVAVYIIIIFSSYFLHPTAKVANHNHHHHDLRSVAAAAAVAYPDARPNDYLGYCDPAAVNLWRMVVPRGGGPAHHPDSVAPYQPPTTAAATAEPPHWGYGPWSSMPAPPPTSRHHQQGVKRHFNESDDCDDAFSEESSKDHCSSPGDGTDTPHMLTRKKRRGIIEKRRRDRINTSLSELRRLVPTAYEKQGSAKLEKAEILQLTVDHLKMIHAKGLDTLAYDPSKYAMDYHNIGFRECANEVARYLESVEGMNGRDPLRERLLSHLQYFAAQREYAAKSPAAAGHHNVPPPPPGWYGGHHVGAPPPPPPPPPPTLPPAHHYPSTTSPHQQQQQQPSSLTLPPPPPPPSHNNNNYETSATAADGIKAAAEADATGLTTLSSVPADYHHHHHHHQQQQRQHEQQHHHRGRDDYQHQHQHGGGAGNQLHNLQPVQPAPQPPSGYHDDAAMHQQHHHQQQQQYQPDSSVSAQMKPYRPWGAEVAY